MTFVPRVARACGNHPSTRLPRTVCCVRFFRMTIPTPAPEKGDESRGNGVASFRALERLRLHAQRELPQAVCAVRVERIACNATPDAAAGGSRLLAVLEVAPRHPADQRRRCEEG